MKALLLLAATVALTLGAPDFRASGGHHGEHHGEHHEHHEGHHGDHGEHHERVAEDVVSYAAPVEPVKTVSGVSGDRRIARICPNQTMISQMISRYPDPDDIPEYPRIR